MAVPMPINSSLFHTSRTIFGETSKLTLHTPHPTNLARLAAPTAYCGIPAPLFPSIIVLEYRIIIDEELRDVVPESRRCKVG
jgi:hypothetical protein